MKASFYALSRSISSTLAKVERAESSIRVVDSSGVLGRAAACALKEEKRRGWKRLETTMMDVRDG